jgi:hypothetical protein
MQSRHRLWCQAVGGIKVGLSRAGQDLRSRILPAGPTPDSSPVDLDHLKTPGYHPLSGALRVPLLPALLPLQPLLTPIIHQHTAYHIICT